MVVSACPERSGEPVEPRSRGVFSPCSPRERSRGCQCGNLLPGVQCGPHQRSRCVKFLDYIQQLHRTKAHNILIQELKDLIIKSIN